MFSTIAFSLFLAQADAAAAPDTNNQSAIDFARRAAIAAERSADAAERTAKAAEIAAGIPQADASAPAAPKKAMFSGTAGFSFVALTGNSNALTGNLNIGMNLNIGAWGVGLKGLGTYGRARFAGQVRDEDTALNISAEAKGSRSFTNAVGIYILGGYGMDHVAKIDWRAYAEAGAQITFFRRMEGDLVKLQLVSELGARYQRESWYQFYASASTPVGRINNPTPNMLFIKASADFRYAINKNVVFSERVDLLPDVITPINFNMLSATALSVKLIGPLSLNASFVVKFDNLPPPGAQKLDTILSLGADVTF